MVKAQVASYKGPVPFNATTFALTLKTYKPPSEDGGLS